VRGVGIARHRGWKPCNHAGGHRAKGVSAVDHGGVGAGDTHAAENGGDFVV
jgi:hypothetical protein